MTAAHADAQLVACPTCAAPAGTSCTWPDATPRKTPHIARLARAPHVNTGREARDITAPIHAPRHEIDPDPGDD